MTSAGERTASDFLTPERVAYWYLRLNGFFQIENFVIHPERSGSQRTDADILAVRFPFRAERLIDEPTRIMRDDIELLSLSSNLVDVVIAEVKTNQTCMLNGPWTDASKENIHRAIAAIGCFETRSEIDQAAQALYSGKAHSTSILQIRLIAIGKAENPALSEEYPEVTQLVWSEVLAFIWHRFHEYKRAKTQVDQWDDVGKRLKKLADDAENEEAFVRVAKDAMGVQN